MLVGRDGLPCGEGKISPMVQLSEFLMTTSWSFSPCIRIFSELFLSSFKRAIESLLFGAQRLLNATNILLQLRISG